MAMFSEVVDGLRAMRVSVPENLSDHGFSSGVGPML